MLDAAITPTDNGPYFVQGNVTLIDKRPKGRVNTAVPSPSLLTRRRSKRPATPEVAGSSPVAPVLSKCLR